MRYTAVTCDPNDFMVSPTHPRGEFRTHRQADQYTLRQRLYDPPRQTELFIVITMYNEDDELFCRTMRGVMQNVAHLCGRGKSKTWGKDGWKKVSWSLAYPRELVRKLIFRSSSAWSPMEDKRLTLGRGRYWLLWGCIRMGWGRMSSTESRWYVLFPLQALRPLGVVWYAPIGL